MSPFAQFLGMAVAQGAAIFALGWLLAHMRRLQGKQSRVRCIVTICGIWNGVVLAGFGLGTLLGGITSASLGLALTLCCASVVGAIIATILWVSED